MYNDYQSRTKKIIKWYEYHMNMPNETDPIEAAAAAIDEQSTVTNDSAYNTQPEDIMSLQEANDMLTEMTEEEEAAELANSGLSDVDQALVADIMARFKDAKQSSVDSVFASTSEPSQEDLVASICAPKQNNVDDLVRQAKDQ